MFARDAVFTVHTFPEAEEPSARVVLVREGFSFWAFVLTILWTLSHRLWLLSALYITLTVLLLKGGQAIGLDEASRGMLQFGLQVWLGFSAHDFQRDALARRGYAETGVVIAPSALLAEQRYYDHVHA